MKNLTERKTSALEAYREARDDWFATVSRKNLHGDQEKWIAFCDAKKNCMLLGVRI